MLTKEELEKFKSLTGFNLGQIETDYLQHLFLLFLSKYIKDELIFKGGTALQKTYSLNRFSEDLDFTLVKEIDIGSIIKKITKDISNFGFEAEFNEFKSKTSKNYRLRIKGPLYNETEKSIASLRIEISTRNDSLLKPEIKEIIPVYNDLQPYLLLVMEINEILSEKIRTIFQREKARDVYDIWFLLKREVKPDFKLINKKMKFFDLKFSKTQFSKKTNLVKKIWKEELKGYVNIIPNFKDVKKFIFSKIISI